VALVGVTLRLCPVGTRLWEDTAVTAVSRGGMECGGKPRGSVSILLAWG